ncbi:NADPH oxidase 5-like [Antedon mediterranea]|uniref:NADPH oxidase 5-like n=1 Tax=Antedon mediterranea TaxID=105859 RepID=UPI003AF5472B
MTDTETKIDHLKVDNIKLDTISTDGSRSNQSSPNGRRRGSVYMDEDTKWLMWVEKQFSEIAGEDREIDFDEFKTALGIKKSFFAERFFSLFDTDGSGTITLDELMEGLQLLTRGDSTDKLRFLFDVYDVDGSGQIDKTELRLVISSCMEESRIQLTDDVIDQLTDALFQSADTDASGSISFDELRVELQKNPEVMENMTISAAQWLRPPVKEKVRYIPRYLTKQYLRNNIKKVVFLAFILLLNVALFLYSMWQYRESNIYVMIARGGGMCLNFDATFILVLMLRKCLTYLRGTCINNILPLDQNISFHKLIGISIAFFSLIHTVAHIGNAVEISKDDNFTFYELLVTDPSLTDFGLVPGSAYVTGWLLLTIIIIIVICSMPFVRRGGYFQVFYWTHLLYVAFWTLLLIHGPRFFYFFALPGFIFIIEKITNTKLFKQAQFGSTYVEDVKLFPSGVTQLVMTRPPRFHFKAGDYIFLQIPAIAQYEWHPFTISSPPEQTGTLSVHVRSAGNWTCRLYSFFEQRIKEEKEAARQAHRKNVCHSNRALEIDEPVFVEMVNIDGDQSGTEVVVSDPSGGKIITHMGNGKHKKNESSPKQNKNNNKNNGLPKIRVFIDGPYGTPTRGIFQSDHAVLIGAGIGVTPFASILQSVMYRHKLSTRTCPSCQHCWLDETLAAANMRLKKVDFIWINRDQKSFEWFISLLTQLEMEQASKPFDRFLELQMYMTSALKKTDMKGIGLQMALDIMHQKDNRDLITGLKTRTQPGRPDWKAVMSKIASENKGKVRVFFCGSPALAKTLKKYCSMFHFEFHKENF